MVDFLATIAWRVNRFTTWVFFTLDDRAYYLERTGWGGTDRMGTR